MERVDLEGFKEIINSRSSDMFMSIMVLFRERLLSSENYWCYKRSYELHTATNSNAGEEFKSSSVSNTGKRFLAPSCLNIISPLAHYSDEEMHLVG
jgi:hypothetical protein